MALLLVTPLGQANLVLISASLLLVPIFVIRWLEKLKQTELRAGVESADEGHERSPRPVDG